VVGPSGKGVDASMVIHELGGETIALGLTAGFEGRHHSLLLDEWGVEHDFVTAEGYTREAFVLVDTAAGKQSTIASSTLIANPHQGAELMRRCETYSSHAWGAIFGGSLPAGLPDETYARWLSAAQDAGLVTLLDTSGEPLREGIRGRPHYLKVNLRELGALLESSATPEESSGSRRSLSGASLLVDEAAYGSDESLKELIERLSPGLGRWAQEAIIITLGAYGALALTMEGHYVAHPPEVEAVNTAGAGDALAGGLMLQRSRSEGWPRALQVGVAAAASVVTGPRTGVCRREEVEALAPQVTIRRID
jgi:1-phosphofructokinase family hexose kinase